MTDVMDKPRRSQSRQSMPFDPALADALATLFREERERVAKLIEAERSTTVAEAHKAIAEDVRRLAETSAELFDQRRTSLLLGIDDLAEQVRSFSNPAELVGAKWLTDSDLVGDTGTATKALLPEAWGDVIYD